MAAGDFVPHDVNSRLIRYGVVQWLHPHPFAVWAHKVPTPVVSYAVFVGCVFVVWLSVIRPITGLVGAQQPRSGLVVGVAVAAAVCLVVAGVVVAA